MYESMFPTAGTAHIAPAAREEVTKAVEEAVICSSFHEATGLEAKILALRAAEC
jgi:hypothetical protein